MKKQSVISSYFSTHFAMICCHRLMLNQHLRHEPPSISPVAVSVLASQIPHQMKAFLGERRIQHRFRSDISRQVRANRKKFHLPCS
jgi:hypothetical protein